MKLKNTKEKGVEKQMIRFIINIVELYIICKIVYKILKFTIGWKLGIKTGKRKGLGIMGKIGVLISRRIHNDIK